MLAEVDLRTALGLPEDIPPTLNEGEVLQLYLLTRTNLDAAPAKIAHARALYWLAKRDVAQATLENPENVQPLKVIMYQRRADILFEILNFLRTQGFRCCYSCCFYEGPVLPR
jgi:hypothetical protein